MKLGHIHSLNAYIQDHDSAFRIVNVNPPIKPLPDPGEEGMIRYNTKRQAYEGFVNGEWSELVTDAALFGPNGSSGSGNVTREAMKNILSQLFKTSDGTIHVIHKGGSKNHGDGYGIPAGEIQPLPGHISVPALAGNTITPTGVWPQGGNNFIVCTNINASRSVNGAVLVDFPKMFKMSTGPVAIPEGGTGGVFIVGTLEGKVRKLSIASPGSRYSVGDKISILPGTKWDDNTETYNSAGAGAEVSVETVDANGAVLTVSVDKPGSGYSPESRFNYIFDVVSGLAGNADVTGASADGALIDFSTHAVPAWVTSPDMSLDNNVDLNYGKYMFNMEALANQTHSASSGFFITCKFICTLYKFKEFSNLV